MLHYFGSPGGKGGVEVGWLGGVIVKVVCSSDVMSAFDLIWSLLIQNFDLEVIYFLKTMLAVS